MGWFNDAWDWLKHGAEDAGKWAEQAIKDAANWGEQAGKDIGNSFTDVAKELDSAAMAAWKASSAEADAIASGVEDAGLKIGNGFVAGAQTVGKVIEEGAEQTGKGLVAAYEYTSVHLCDVAIGSLLSGAFLALAADGEEVAAVGGIAALCAEQSVDNTALKSGSMVLALIIVEPVYAIPGVSSALGHKSDVEALIAFLVFTACKDNPKLTVKTGGQYLAGAVIYGLTSAICEGKLPAGYQAALDEAKKV